MPKLLKTIPIVVLLVTSLLLMAACGNAGVENNNKNQANPASGSKLKVGFAVPDQNIPYFVLQISSIKKLVEEQGGELIVANAGMDINKQINNVEDLIASKVQALIAFPIDPKPLEASLQKAQEAGIKVVGWGSFDIQHADVIVNSDAKMVGKLVGEHAAKWINEKFGGKADVGLIVSTANAGLTDRSVALEEAIRKNAPNANIVSKQEALNVADSQKVAENMLTANPNMQVIATVEDSQGLGAYEAVKAAGRAKGDFYINGIGATPEALAKIKEGGVFRATLDMESATMAQRLADTAVKMAKGEPVEKLQYAKLTVVDSSNLSMFMK